MTIAIKCVRPEDIAQNEIMDSNYSGDQLNYGKQHEIDNRPLENSYGPLPSPAEGSWLESARNVLNGPTGQIVVHMAKEMISRSTGNSQVVFLHIFYRNYLFKKKRKNEMNSPLKTQFPSKHVIPTDFEFKFNELADFGTAEGVDICCRSDWSWQLGTVCTCS